MEELKVLIGMVSDLPQMAIWVLVGFFCYKVVIIGSVFSIIKLSIERLHNFLVTPKEKLTILSVRGEINGITITDHIPELLDQIKRLKGVRSSSTCYIHGSDIDWLREAIDEKKVKETKS